MSSLPSITLCATPRMYAAFLKVIPKLCSLASDRDNTEFGDITPRLLVILFQTVSCAFEEICCPTIELIRAENRSGLTSRFSSPIASIASPNLLSYCFRWAVCFFPYLKKKPCMQTPKLCQCIDVNKNQVISFFVLLYLT